MKNCKIVSCGKKTAVMALAVSVGAMLMTGCSTQLQCVGEHCVCRKAGGDRLGWRL